MESGIKRIAVLSFVVVAGIVCLGPGPVLAETHDGPRFEVYGYIKADVIYDFKRTLPAWSSTLRPSQIIIPGPDTPYYDEGEMIFSLRASRLGFNLLQNTAGEPIVGRFEIDFFGVGANAGQQLPRLRQAYVSYGEMLVGQAWSLFNDVDVWPVTMDFWGPCGLMSSRRPQVRWTPVTGGKHRLAVAAEQSGAGLDAGKGPQYDRELDVRPRSVLPDLTVQYRNSGSHGYVQLAGIARSLAYEGTINIGEDETDFDDSVAGWGLYLSGKWETTGTSGLYASLAYGEGIGNYANDGGVDVAPDDDLLALAVPLLGWHVSYDMIWNPHWSTSLGASQTIQENTGGQLGYAFHIGSYTFLNLVYYPQSQLSYGMEFLWGARENKNGDNNDDSRLNFAAKYLF